MKDLTVTIEDATLVESKNPGRREGKQMGFKPVATDYWRPTKKGDNASKIVAEFLASGEASAVYTDERKGNSILQALRKYLKDNPNLGVRAVSVTNHETDELEVGLKRIAGATEATTEAAASESAEGDPFESLEGDMASTSA